MRFAYRPYAIEPSPADPSEVSFRPELLVRMSGPRGRTGEITVWGLLDIGGARLHPALVAGGSAQSDLVRPGNDRRLCQGLSCCRVWGRSPPGADREPARPVAGHRRVQPRRNEHPSLGPVWIPPVFQRHIQRTRQLLHHSPPQAGAGRIHGPFHPATRPPTLSGQRPDRPERPKPLTTVDLGLCSLCSTNVRPARTARMRGPDRPNHAPAAVRLRHPAPTGPAAKPAGGRGVGLHIPARSSARQDRAAVIR